MDIEMKLRKRQMLESLDYIDDDLISSTLKKIKPDFAAAEPEKMTWRTPLKYWRQFVALAACLLLLSVASPLVSYIAEVIGGLEFGLGSQPESTLIESDETGETENANFNKIAHLSNGLVLELSRDGEYYIVDSGRECIDPVIVIPDTYNGLPISMIAEGAFVGNETIKSLTISENVIWIDQLVFSGCDSLEFNEYGNAKYLGSADNPYAFLISGVSEDIESVDIHESTRAIAGRAFLNNTKLTAVKIPDSVIAIAKAAFSYTALSKLDLGEGIKYIGEQAFLGCSALTEIVLPASIISLGGYSFKNCSSVTRLEINEGIESIGHSSFEGLAIESVVIPDSVTELYGIFDNCGSLKKVVIGDGVSVIDLSAFSHCIALTDIEFGKSVKRIEYIAFSYCTSLEKVTLPEGLEYLDPKAFSGCENLQYNLYKGARYLGSAENDYEYLVGFESTDISSLEFHPDMRRLMTKGLSELTSLNEISIKDGKYLYVDRNCLIDRDSGTLIAGLNNSVIPYDGSIKAIGDYAFYGCKGWSASYLPEKIESIGDYAFSRCEGIREMNFPQSLVSIGNHSFEDCDRLSKVRFPLSLKSIGDSAFKSCSITELVIPDSVTELGSEVFRSCYKLKSVKIGEGIAEIPGWGFQSCIRLKEVVFPSGLKIIGDRAFAVCDELSSITFPEGLLYINDNAFQSCKTMTDLYLPDSLIGVGYMAFEECSLTSVRIGEGLCELGENAFGKNPSDMTVNFSGTAEMWKKIDNYNKISKTYEAVTVECADGKLTVTMDY